MIAQKRWTDAGRRFKINGPKHPGAGPDMEIISFECPQCHQPMGVAAEQRGQQVQCPHCYQIVQAPAPAGASAAATPASSQAAAPSVSPLPSPEGLFPPPEGTAKDNAFGFVPSAPAGETPVPQRSAAPAYGAGVSPAQAVPAEPALHSGFITDELGQPAPTPPGEGPTYREDTMAAQAAPPSELPADAFPGAAARPRRVDKRSLLTPILLIFLVPYSVIITAFLAWHLYHQSQARFDPLERLPDPKPGKGGAVRIHPTRSALPAKLKTALNQPLRVGDLEVTPLRVEKDEQGRLSLYLKLRDVSPDVAFNPVLPAEDYQFRRISMEDTGPYTYVEAGDRRLYMRGAEWEQTPQRKQGALFDGMLQPGEEMVAVFRTQADDKGLVQAATGTLVWRVQLRRGLVTVGDTEVSATAVVGIAFDARAIAVPAPARSNS
jgi:hypothetical protein